MPSEILQLIKKSEPLPVSEPAHMRTGAHAHGHGALPSRLAHHTLPPLRSSHSIEPFLLSERCMLTTEKMRGRMQGTWPGGRLHAKRPQRHRPDHTRPCRFRSSYVCRPARLEKNPSKHIIQCAAAPQRLPACASPTCTAATAKASGLGSSTCQRDWTPSQPARRCECTFRMQPVCQARPTLRLYTLPASSSTSSSAAAPVASLATCPFSCIVFHRATASAMLVTS